jgi:MtN3 and saliva related transmembrane protein
MTREFLTTLLGSIAALCTTAAFIPQLVKLYRFGGRDLSYTMLLIYWLGVVLWLAYGLLTSATEVVVANATGSVLVSACIGLKRWNLRQLVTAPHQTKGRQNPP